MVDYVDLWDRYSIEFCKKLEYDCNGDWGKLDPDEQEIAALWKLVVDINNGGFEQFFCNWGYECYWYAMRGIQRMGRRDIVEVFHGTYTDVFDKFKNDARIKAYWDIPEYFSDDDKKRLNETDDWFYEGKGEELCKSAYEFYHDNLKKAAK